MLQQVVSILANTGSLAEIIIRKAVRVCRELGVYIHEGGIPPRKTDKRPAWSILAQDNGWVIEENQISKHIRLLSPEGKREVSIFFDDKIQLFWSKLIEIGEEELKINDCLSNMALDKDGEFILLVGRMGAKHVYSVSIENKSTGFSFNGAGNRGDNSPVGSFSVGVNTDIKGNLKKYEKYNAYFEDDMANFSDDLLINSKWFKNDKKMNLLFTLRKEKNLTSFDYESSLSDGSSIDFSFEVRNIGVDEARLKGAFEKQNCIYRKFTVEF